ncbi:uncharacterized protein LOC126767202 [Bactrocera neohumeralis]|uniref:uncharacterized protein LOC126751437 n=1 Tax=Bactrocera neohumeralis TaxID=98809 RepID=UPI002166C145|nr:uncharacterized protein LOC126751437 [Bactrocera neohumeralis]XP_050340733.1 uncharacterized protein LOC126767202 [Bactrocera neohumeralis]
MTRYSALKKTAALHPNRYPLSCTLCKGKHPLRLCSSFRAKTPEERLREALIGKYCINCLAVNHKSANCPSDARCRRCNEKHHTMLHIGENTRRRPAVPQNQPWSEQISSDDALSIEASDPGTETRPLQPEPEEGELIETGAETRPFRPSQRGETETRTFRPLLQHERRAHKRRLRRRQEHNSARLETRSLQIHRASSFRAGLADRASIATPSLLPTTAILPTAVVKIEARGRLHLVRALIDACAPTSLISHDLLKELQLVQTHIGGQRGCLVVLRGRHGTNTRMSTHVRVIHGYMRISPTTTLDAAIAAPYTHIKLADPNFHKSSPIRLVLGADVYSRIMTQQVMSQTFGQLLAQGSIFGWVLSGTARY